MNGKRIETKTAMRGPECVTFHITKCSTKESLGRTRSIESCTGRRVNVTASHDFCHYVVGRQQREVTLAICITLLWIMDALDWDRYPTKRVVYIKQHVR